MIKRISEARRRRDAGFTLIELLVVIVILGVLSAVVVFAVRGSGDKGAQAAIATDKRILQTAQEAFCANNGRYASQQELKDARYISDYSQHWATEPKPGGSCTAAGIPEKSGYTITEPGVGGGGSQMPVTGWAPAADLLHGEEGEAVQLLDGKVLRVTSTSGGGAELYDPAAGVLGAWQSTSPSGYLGQYLTLVAGGNCGNHCGKALGHFEESGQQTNWQLYSQGGGWASIPVQPEFHRGSGATATVLGDGRVAIIGGRCCTGPRYIQNPQESPQSAVTGDTWDPVTQRWSRSPAFTTGRVYHSAALLRTGANAGKVLVVGGSAGECVSFNSPCPLAESTAMFFDPAVGGISAPSPNFLYGRGHRATLLSDGRVLLTGGRSATSTAEDKAEVYDPSANGGVGAWTPTSNACACDANHSATRLDDGRVLMVRGADTGEAQLYDPRTNTWSQATPANQSWLRHSATRLDQPNCGSHCGKVLVAGGQNRKFAELYAPE